MNELETFKFTAEETEMIIEALRLLERTNEQRAEEQRECGEDFFSLAECFDADAKKARKLKNKILFKD